MKEQLYEVGIKHKETDQKINLQVWAKNVNEATWGLRGLIGPYTEYVWTGSGPIYDDNGEVITRETPT